MTAPTCEALDAHLDIPCGAPATVVGSKNEQQAYLCSDDANRALEAGWTIGPAVSDVQSFLAGIDEDEQ